MVPKHHGHSPHCGGVKPWRGATASILHAFSFSATSGTVLHSFNDNTSRLYKKHVCIVWGRMLNFKFSYIF